VMLAMRRRMREEGAAAVQRLAEDFMPLVLLFAVSVSGLMLTASYTWMKGYAYDFLAILHAVTVIFTFLWLPFGKFFHVFQRPAQLGVGFYKDVGTAGERARCRRCGHGFTSRMHVDDLVDVEHRLGYSYEIPGSPVISASARSNSRIVSGGRAGPISGTTSRPGVRATRPASCSRCTRSRWGALPGASGRSPRRNCRSSHTHWRRCGRLSRRSS